MRDLTILHKKHTHRHSACTWTRILSLLIIFVLLCLSFACTDQTGDTPTFSPGYVVPGSGTPTAVPTDTNAYTEMTLLSVGDIMYHRPQFDAVYDSVTQTYDFSGNFQYVKELISAADLAVANYETTLHNNVYTSYPTFCSPVETLDSIKDAGFDVLLYANNHIYDRQQPGLLNTLERFKEWGFAYVGATPDPETQRSCRIFDVKGIKIGIINYADSLTADLNGMHTINGIAIPNEYFYHMNIYVQGQETEFYSRVADDLAYFEENQVDIVVSYLHWGWEYNLEENAYQRETAQKLCNMGVDVIIGSHPHVVQPMDTLVSETDANHSTLVFYSLGNYISNQNRSSTNWSSAAPAQGYSENGLTVTLTIRKYEHGRTLVSKIEYTPTWVHKYSAGNKLHYEVLPLPITEADYSHYGLTKSVYGVSHALESYTRTDSALREDVAAFNQKAVEAINMIEGRS